MNRKTISDAVTGVREEYLLEALALEDRAGVYRLHRGGRRTMSRTARMGLVAAILALLLATAAVAVYQHSVKDLIMEWPQGPEYTAQAAESPAADAASAEPASIEPAAAQPPDMTQPFFASTRENGTKLYFYSISGYDKQSPEYKAQQEWLYYRFYGDKTYDARELLSHADPHRIYGVGYRSMADVLDALAAKYGLELVTGEYYLDGDYYGGDGIATVYDLLDTEPFVSTGFAMHNGDLYNDGSFRLCGDLSVPGREEPVFLWTYCAMDGTLTTFNEITADAPDSLVCESYTTRDGVTAELALGSDFSMVFVNMENSHILLWIQCGTSSEFRSLITGESRSKDSIDMQTLRAIADSFDFAAMDQYDRAQRARTVSALFAEQVEEYGWNDDPGGEARDIYDLLGTYELTALPEGYAFYHNQTVTPEESHDSMWADITGGGAMASVSIQYQQPEDKYETRAIYFDYGRYWQDEAMTTVNDRLGYEPRYILLGDPDTTVCAVGDCEGYYYTEPMDDRLELYWLDDARQLVFHLSLPKGFTLEDAIAMAESVAPAG